MGPSSHTVLSPHPVTPGTLASLLFLKHTRHASAFGCSLCLGPFSQIYFCGSLFNLLWVFVQISPFYLKLHRPLANNPFLLSYFTYWLVYSSMVFILSLSTGMKPHEGRGLCLFLITDIFHMTRTDWHRVTLNKSMLNKWMNETYLFQFECLLIRKGAVQMTCWSWVTSEITYAKDFYLISWSNSSEMVYPQTHTYTPMIFIPIVKLFSVPFMWECLFKVSTEALKDCITYQSRTSVNSLLFD